eukprot:scaffold5475_cov127-Isochrysis_galbana.AAC.2
MIGRAPGEMVRGGGGKGGNASLPGDSRVSRRIRPLALLIFKKKFLLRSQPMPRAGALASGQAERQQCAVQAPGEHKGVARARNHTCSELSSVLSTRTRAAPLSMAETTSLVTGLQPKLERRHRDPSTRARSCFFSNTKKNLPRR